MKEKTVTRRGTSMNTLGRLMWSAVSKKLGDFGLVKHGLSHMGEALNVTPRTAERMLRGEAPVTFEDMVRFQEIYDDDDVQDYIDAAFKTARTNGRKAKDYVEPASKVSALRDDEQHQSGSPEQGVLQAVRKVLDDYFGQGGGRRRKT